MKIKDLVVLVILMIIGEVVFVLPFVIIRIFRPTFLTVFDISNLELGTAFSVYGVVAMVAYFAGGPVADRFKPKQLIPTALLATAAGGLLLYTIPSVGTLAVLYGFWGASTILLFWSAFVKSQRQLGRHTGQGKSFGLVDAGRGLVAALMATSSVYLLDWLLPTDAAVAAPADFKHALQQIILIFSLLTAVCGLLAWLVLGNEQSATGNHLNLKGIRQVMSKRTIWQQAIIVLCAYVGYKCTDDFSLYARDTLQYDDVDAAHLAAITFWARPAAAIISGLLADKWITSKVVMVCFVITMIGSLVISTGVWGVGTEVFVIITATSTSSAIYGLRGIYYALFEESGLPMKVTGSAAGLVSVVGYTPDVFMGPLMGVILDNNPGPLGHQYLFGLLAAFSLVGLIASVAFHKSTPEA
ncbi:MFS transporter [Marinoscillum sp.]|uniref:MFS transporter n=1 Tax=Marinoscillum sp. TaxID=2024838 RepID=UPI003BAD8D86